MIKQNDNRSSKGACISRRAFMFRSSAVAAGTVFLPALPGMNGQALAAEVARYPRQLIGKLSQLKAQKPVTFNYPDKGANSRCMLVKLNETAGGGIGKDLDVVAFNTFCTHMGGDMGRAYKPEHNVLGQCPLHQSTFDLTRHGMVVSGHGTESLPQVLLEVDGDNIYAVGMIGLIHGRYDNLKG